MGGLRVMSALDYNKARIRLKTDTVNRSPQIKSISIFKVIIYHPRLQIRDFWQVTEPSDTKRKSVTTASIIQLYVNMFVLTSVLFWRVASKFFLNSFSRSAFFLSASSDSATLRRISDSRSAISTRSRSRSANNYKKYVDFRLVLGGRDVLNALLLDLISKLHVKPSPNPRIWNYLDSSFMKFLFINTWL